MQHSQNHDVFAMYVLKLIRVTAGYFHSFRILSKESLGIMYPKNPVLDKIEKIHLRNSSFGQKKSGFGFK